MGIIMFFGGGFPGGFPGGIPGGFPGGFPGDFQENNKEVNTQEYYERLGLDKEASFDDIRKAYRKKAMQHHPDRGGDPEVFKKITQAYEVLSNEEKRGLYDKYGEEGVQGDGVPSNTNDIFNMMFGGNGRQNVKKKTKDVIKKIAISLDDIYNGKETMFSIKHKRICQLCKGRGIKENATKKS